MGGKNLDRYGQRQRDSGCKNELPVHDRLLVSASTGIIAPAPRKVLRTASQLVVPFDLRVILRRLAPVEHAVVAYHTHATQPRPFRQ